MRMARKSTGKPVKKAGTRVRTPKPIALYYWSTPNGHKIGVVRGEGGVASDLPPVEGGKGHRFDPVFLKIPPNIHAPAIVDPHGPGAKPISVFESGAIL